MTRTARKPSDLGQASWKVHPSRTQAGQGLGGVSLDHLNSIQGVYLFGGVLRDIALYGISRLETDIDLVCDGARESIGSVVEESGLAFKTNRFGGFRVKTAHWFVDLWNARDTWAFREGGQRYDGVESLLGTTITNWESILFQLKGYRLIHAEGYFRDLNERYLHIVFDRNPNPLGMYVRVLRAYTCKDASVLSNRAARVLREALQKYSFEDLSRLRTRALSRGSHREEGVRALQGGSPEAESASGEVGEAARQSLAVVGVACWHATTRAGRGLAAQKASSLLHSLHND